MKKITLLALLGCSSIVSQAQNGFYCSASFGAGRSSQNEKTYEGMFYDTYRYGRIRALQASAEVGYRLHNWRLVTGLQYLSDGYSQTGPIYGNNYYYTVEHFTHLSIPVRVGYAINIGKGFSVVPSLGVSVGYNFNPVTVDKNYGMDRRTRMSDANFERFEHRRVSLWAQGQADVRYQLCRSVAVTAGPRYNYMITALNEMQLWPDHKPVRFKSWTMNVGIELNLHCRRHAAAKPAAAQ